MVPEKWHYWLCSILACTLVCKHPCTHIYLTEKHARTYNETIRQVSHPLHFFSHACLSGGNSVCKSKDVDPSLDLRHARKKHPNMVIHIWNLWQCQIHKLHIQWKTLSRNKITEEDTQIWTATNMYTHSAPRKAKSGQFSHHCEAP